MPIICYLRIDHSATFNVMLDTCDCLEYILPDHLSLRARNLIVNVLGSFASFQIKLLQQIVYDVNELLSTELTVELVLVALLALLLNLHY